MKRTEVSNTVGLWLPKLRTFINIKGNGHYVCQEIVEDGRCLVEREKERSHKHVNFYSSESRIELH